MEQETNNPQAALRATVDPLLKDYLRRRRNLAKVFNTNIYSQANNDDTASNVSYFLSRAFMRFLNFET